MKQRAIAYRALKSAALSSVLLLLSAMPALAHGAATLTVSPEQAVPGDPVTLQGEGLEAGEVFLIRLEGLSVQLELGEVSVAEGEDGFNQVFTLPPDIPPGDYQVTATSEEGESLSVELAVLQGASAGPTSAREPSAEPMELDRGKSPLQITLILVGLLISTALGVVLVRVKE